VLYHNWWRIRHLSHCNGFSLLSRSSEHWRVLCHRIYWCLFWYLQWWAYCLDELKSSLENYNDQSVVFDNLSIDLTTIDATVGSRSIHIFRLEMSAFRYPALWLQCLQPISVLHKATRYHSWLEIDKSSIRLDRLF